MIDLEKIDLDDLRPTVPDGYKESYKMWSGEHWQDGAGWESVLPDPSENAKEYQSEKKRVEEAFTSQNVVREIVERHLNGVTGRLPSVDYLRNPGSEDPERAEDVAEAMPGADDLVGLLREAGRYTLCGATPHLRLYPGGKAFDEEDSLREDLDFALAAQLLTFKVVKPSQGLVTEIDGEEIAAYWRKDEQESKVVEVSILDDDGNTVLGIIEQGKTADGPERTVDQSTPLDLGMKLHMTPIERETLVTSQVRQQQHAVNKALTMSDTNLDWAGFTERIFLNAQRPQEKVEKATGETEWVDAPYRLGAGETSFLAGIVTEGAEGDQSVKNPSVEFREPTPVDTFKDTHDLHYETLLSEADQRHVLMSGDASSSGVARIAARKEFIASLRPTMRALSSGGQWLLEVMPMLASVLIGETGVMENVVPSLNLRLDRGVLSEGEIRVLMEQVEKEQLSLRTMLDRIGISDVDQELDRLAEENISTVKRREAMATITKELSAAGANIRAAARVAGFSDEEADELMEAAVPRSRQ